MRWWQNMRARSTFFCTIPGVDRNSAITIISEIGTDMSQFGSFQAPLLLGWIDSRQQRICRKEEVLSVFPEPVFISNPRWFRSLTRQEGQSEFLLCVEV